MMFTRAGEVLLLTVIAMVAVLLVGVISRVPIPMESYDVTSPAETPTPHADIGGVVRGPSHADRGDLYVLAAEW
jgi:hypothetical protein